MLNQIKLEILAAIFEDAAFWINTEIDYLMYLEYSESRGVPPHPQSEGHSI